jgi:uncharacterized membrane protein YphA (DoxX/SURF4 family)
MNRIKIIKIKKLSVVLRILVGALFIASAILKYISIDTFDMYVFDHNLFSLSVTETLTRLLITAECVIGIMLVFNIYIRFAYYTVLALLAGFTIYLFLLPYLFDVEIDNCHCAGDAIVLNRTESIIKNIILIVCLMFVSIKFYIFRKWETYVTIALWTVIFTVFMIVQTPNYLYTVVHKEKIVVDVPLYELALLNSGKKEAFTDGKQIICMYATGCIYCQKTAAKLHSIMKNRQLPEEKIKAIFWTGSPDSVINNFFYDRNILIPEYTTFKIDTFLDIIHGHLPTILFSDDGAIVHSANYVTLNEKKTL